MSDNGWRSGDEKPETHGFYDRQIGYEVRRDWWSGAQWFGTKWVKGVGPVAHAKPCRHQAKRWRVTVVKP